MYTHPLELKNRCRVLSYTTRFLQQPPPLITNDPSRYIARKNGRRKSQETSEVQKRVRGDSSSSRESGEKLYSESFFVVFFFLSSFFLFAIKGSLASIFKQFLWDHHPTLFLSFQVLFSLASFSFLFVWKKKKRLGRV